MARDRSIKLVIEAQVAGAKRALNETAEAARKVGTEADKASKQSTSASERMVKSARDNREAWQTAGTTLAAFGASATLAMGGSAKAAIDWQSAFAGVRKTVDTTEQGFAQLEEGLRGMARELPASHAEIAAVAEAAGQLGIQTPNILDFTQTMIDLGESTNLSAEQAATALARFANIMGTSQAEFDNIGSAVVDLGNNFATTEAEIVEMGLRLAGAGRQAKLSEGEVLGLATALSSVGIEADAGGTAFSRVMIEMASAVDSTSAELDTFAQVAGMTSEQFAATWRDNAGEAIAAFIAGLGEMQASGESIQPILADLGLTDIRVGDALRRASGAAEIFTDAMDKGNEAYEANVALSQEAAERYKTVESRMQAARNSFVDAGISLGEVFLPAIGAVADGAAGVAGFLADLPDPLQALAAGAGTAAASVGLLGGGFLILAPRAIESYDAFRKLAGVSPRVNDVLGKMGKTVAVGGVLVTGLAVVGGALGAIQRATEEGIQPVEEFTAALLDMADAGNIASINRMLADLDITVNGLSGMIDGPIEDFGDALDRVLSPNMIQRAEALDKAISFGQVRTSGDRVREFFDQLDGSLSGLLQSGNAELAAEQFDRLWAVAEGRGYDREAFLRLFPQYQAALQGVDNDARLAAGGMDELNAGMAETTPEMEAQQEALDALTEAYETWLGEVGQASASFASVESALSAHQEKTRAWAEEQAASTKTAKDSWQDFYDGQSVNLAKYLDELQAQLDAQANWQTNLESLVGRVSEETLEHLAKLGPEGAPLVAALVDGTEEELARFDELFAQTGETAGVEFALGLAEQQALFNAAAAELGTGVAQEIVDAVRNGEMTVQDAVEEYDLRAELEVAAETSPAAADLLAYIEEVERTTAIAKVGADTSLAMGEGEKWYYDTERMKPVAKIGADPSEAEEVTDSWARWVTEQEPSAKVGADTDPAYGAVGALVQAVGRTWATINVSARYAGGLNIGGANPLYASARASGGIDDRGRYWPRQSMLAGPMYGPKNILWAEDSTRREAYISDHPSFRSRNLGILREVAGWHGMALVKAYAAGGVAQRRFATPTGSSSTFTPNPVGGSITNNDIQVNVAETNADPFAIGAAVGWDLRG